MQVLWANILPVFLRLFFVASDDFYALPNVQFNSTNFYLNASCHINSTIGTITAGRSIHSLTYQLFGSQDFAIHRERGDVIMVKKPRDLYPIFYVSAMDSMGSSATAVVEVSHDCPTVSFDAISYNFFAARRAPGSNVGVLQALGGDDIRYSTDSKMFNIDETTGSISAKVILPLDTTSIFHVKAADRKGNSDIAEVVVEVVGCHVNIDPEQLAGNTIVFPHRCYVFVPPSCQKGVIGTVKAHGNPEPLYHYRDQYFRVHPNKGVIEITDTIEPRKSYLLNIMATNGHLPENRDVALVTVDTRNCSPISQPTVTGLDVSAVENGSRQTHNSTATSSPLSFSDEAVIFDRKSDYPMEFDIFDVNDTLAEDDPVYNRSTEQFPLPFTEFAVGLWPLNNATSNPLSTVSSKNKSSTTTTVSPTKGHSFVVHVNSVNVSKTVRPIYRKNFFYGRNLFKNWRQPQNVSDDNLGIEVV